jgi:CHASE3 domain sensor protein
MRLAFKIFAATTLVVLVLVGVAVWSLLAVDHLVAAHREITSRSLPALQLEVALQDAAPRLRRLEARYLVLRDGAYGELLKERMARRVADLERVDNLLASPAEKKSYREAVAALATYQEYVNEERTLLARQGRGGAGPAALRRAGANGRRGA